VYADDVIKSNNLACNGTATPTDLNFWTTGPKNIKVFSSSPVLGGSNSTGIQFK
jgi:hypothetical protein